MNEDNILYWDTSAILSVLCNDVHTCDARNALISNSAHIISSLAWSEVCSVLYRMGREYSLPDLELQKHYQSLLMGPWRKLNLLPEWSLFEEMAHKYSLRGADLWHLTMVKTLQKDFPEIKMISFDRKLSDAALAEGLGTI